MLAVGGEVRIAPFRQSLAENLYEHDATEGLRREWCSILVLEYDFWPAVLGFDCGACGVLEEWTLQEVAEGVVGSRVEVVVVGCWLVEPDQELIPTSLSSDAQSKMLRLDCR